MMRSLLLALVAAPVFVNGHAALFEPPARNSGGMALLSPMCAGGSCQWYSQGCTIGCAKCSQHFTTGPGAECDCDKCTDPTIVVGQNDSLISFYTDGYNTSTTYFPWRYPGAAPVMNPCGMTGGGIPPLGQEDPPPGVPGGAVGSDQSWAPQLLDKTTWIAGSIVEVASSFAANHGGGYQYRLCRGNASLSESCFEATPMQFVGTGQWFQFYENYLDSDPGNGLNAKIRLQNTAVRVGPDGVLPAGSTWTKVPIPGCVRDGARQHQPCEGPTFTPPFSNFSQAKLREAGYCPVAPFPYKNPVHGVYGYGGGTCLGNATADPAVACTDKEYGDAQYMIGVVDLVQVPDLPDGDYVVSWRYDAEQTKQVWSSCGDVTIKSKGRSTVPFSQQRGCTACCPGGRCANCTGCLHDKTGACAWCWEPQQWWTGNAEGVQQNLSTWWMQRAKPVQCLGYEGSDGGPGSYVPGMSTAEPWSPGCTKCWASPGSCEAQERQLTPSALGAAGAFNGDSPAVVASLTLDHIPFDHQTVAILKAVIAAGMVKVCGTASGDAVMCTSGHVYVDTSQETGLLMAVPVYSADILSVAKHSLLILLSSSEFIDNMNAAGVSVSTVFVHSISTPCNAS